MRYVLQVAVMAGDVALFAAIGVVLWTWRSPVAWVLALLAWREWRATGGLEAWRPSVVRRYLRNARELGL